MKYFDQEFGLVKYVVVKVDHTEQVRFCPNMDNHSSLVKEGEIAISAGFVWYDTWNGVKTYQLLTERSSTLNLSPDYENDPAKLSEILGGPVKLKEF